jgi:bifunctional lysine-specific demethylase and histidyl-hydroxylase NO66
MTLDRCVAVPADVFLAEHYGRRHLHSPAADLPDFTDLFSADSVDTLLTGTGLRASSMRLVRDGREGPVATVAEPGDRSTDAGYPDTDRLRREIAGGSTLILRSLHRYHPPVRALAHALAAQLAAPVRVNAFVTPPNATGVDLHYDVQDVFVLQISGTKRWHLRTPPLPRPLPAQAWFDQTPARRARLRAASTDLADVLLATGDALYLPRGTMHAPRTEGELSIHLTVAVSVLTRHDLLARLVAAAADDPWFREHVCLDDLVADPAAAAGMRAEVTRRLARHAGDTDLPALLWGLRRDAFRDLPPAPVPVLPEPDAPAGSYRLRPGAQYALTTADGGVRLHVPGREVTLPASVAPVLETLRHDRWIPHQLLVDAFGAPDAVTVAGLLTELDLVSVERRDGS